MVNVRSIAESPDTVISYGPSAAAWSGFKQAVETAIREAGATRVVEIGGGANPMFTLEEVKALDLDYTVLDIAQEELDRAAEGYRTVLADVAADNAEVPTAAFDFAFSRMVAEHVQSGEMMHRNVFKMLAPGGHAMHFFPTLFALPFLVNYIIPERQARWVLSKLTPARDVVVTKFPAQYQWCFGPTPRQLKRLASVGFEIERYSGYFGHPGYYSRIPGVRQLHAAKTRFLLRRPNHHLTSYAQVLLKRPSS